MDKAIGSMNGKDRKGAVSQTPPLSHDKNRRMKMKRYQLRASEVCILYGEDSARSEWSLWNDMLNGGSSAIGEYGKWQHRLAGSIMQGVCEDHSLSIQGSLDPSVQGENGLIIPPRAWLTKPSILSGGREAAMVVMQKTSQSMREWKAPGAIPAKHLRRMKAIAAAYGLRDVLVGVLVDGYSSQLFHITAQQEELDDMLARVAVFIESVRNEEEPDIDFTKDEASIRQGISVTKIEAAVETVTSLVNERERLQAERAPADAIMKRIETRMRQIDTSLIHLAGDSMKIDSPDFLVVIERNSKAVPTVKVVKKAPAPLF